MKAFDTDILTQILRGNKHAEAARIVVLFQSSSEGKGSVRMATFGQPA